MASWRQKNLPSEQCEDVAQLFEAMATRLRNNRSAEHSDLASRLLDLADQIRADGGYVHGPSDGTLDPTC